MILSNIMSESKGYKMFKELIEFEEKHYLTSLMTALASICPGFLTIYLFHSELVGSLDIFKLLIFSASIGLPIVVLNSYLIMLPIDNLDENPFALIWTYGAAITVCVSYISLYISYAYSLSFRHYTYIIIAFEVMVGLLCMIVDVANDKKKKISSNKPLEATR